MTDLLDRLERAAAQLRLTGPSAVERRDRSLGEFSGLWFDEIHPDSAAALKDWMAELNGWMDRATARPDDESRANDVLEQIGEMLDELTDMELDLIVRDLDASRGKLPRATIQAARRHRDQIIPRLIGALQQTVECARNGEKVEGNVAFFSLFLLGEFRAREALPAILDAISLPGDLPGDLFGDAVTEYLAPILAALLDGETGTLDRLIVNPDVNEYVRWEAIQTWLHYVRDGQATADEAIDSLRHHLRTALDRQDEAVISPLIVELANLGGVAAREEIETAFQQDAVDLYCISREEVQKALANPEAERKEWLANLKPTGVDDTIAILETWASFQERIPAKNSPPPSVQPQLPKPGFAELNARPPAPAGRLSSNPARRTGRNDPCPCGSQKKFKKCCMRSAMGQE